MANGSEDLWTFWTQFKECHSDKEISDRRGEFRVTMRDPIHKVSIEYYLRTYGIDITELPY